MKGYTIGALFTPDFKQVLLIKKNKPAWQAGKFNLPGGKIEFGESSKQCVSREFKEECNVLIHPEAWLYVGAIENDGHYFVDIFAAVCVNTSRVKSMTDEPVEWVDVNNIPDISIVNLRWIVPFAMEALERGEGENLKFGRFKYTY